MEQKNGENTPHVFSTIPFRPFAYCSLISHYFFLTILEKATTPQFNTLHDYFACCDDQSVSSLSSLLFTDGKHRNYLNFSPVTLKYFLSFLIFLSSTPLPPPFLFF